MRRLLLLLFLFITGFSISLYAQDSLVVKFQEREKSAITDKNLKITDRGGNFCAVVQVSGKNIEQYEFKGQYIRKDSLDAAHGLKTLFISPGHEMTSIKILSKKYPVYTEFLGPLKPLQYYDMEIREFIDQRDKARTLVMPELGIGGIMNYGVLLAFVKKVGPYFKFAYNFNSISDVGKCTDKGNIVGTEKYPYLSGKSEFSRLAATAGVVVRVWQGYVDNSTQAIYVYSGLGISSANQYWQTTDGKWLLNDDHSHSGIALDLGAIYRYKAFALSLGAQATSFKYAEANLGVGVMF